MLGEIRLERTFGPRRVSEVRYADRPLITRSDRDWPDALS